MVALRTVVFFIVASLLNSIAPAADLAHRDVILGMQLTGKGAGWIRTSSSFLFTANDGREWLEGTPPMLASANGIAPTRAATKCPFRLPARDSNAVAEFQTDDSGAAWVIVATFDCDDATNRCEERDRLFSMMPGRAAVDITPFPATEVHQGMRFTAPGPLLAQMSGPAVQLNWARDTARPDALFRLYRAEGSGWTLLTPVPVDRTVYLDDRAPLGEATYRVVVVNRDGSDGAEALSSVVVRRAPLAIGTDGASYDKNNIIDDSQEQNSSTMDANAIQTFLNAHSGPLKTYSSVGLTAAQQIYNACVTYAINPYLVLTTLQKEQSLITNAYADPAHLAMGWNTPDTSTYDFYDQVHYGTRQFNLYYTRGLAYYGWAVGQPHSVSDGTVTPANAATANLYLYTPWIGGPTGVGGNYSFWNLWYNTFGFGGGSGSDTTIPSVTITSPCSSSCTVNSSPITVSGTATDSGGSGLASVFVDNSTANSYGTAFVSGNSSSYSVSNIALSTGTNYIYVQAVDNANNYGNVATITVNYQPQQCYILTALGNPSNAGYPQVNTNFNCGNGYSSGTAISLTAAAYNNNSYQFSYWTATNCTLANSQSVNTTCTVTGAGDVTVTANFTPVASCYTLAASPSPQGGGTANINTAQNCSGGYTASTTVSISASPNNGYSFSNWSSTNCTVSGPTAAITSCVMTGGGNATVTANFNPVACYSLTASASPQAGGTASVNTAQNCTGGYTQGTAVSIFASPNANYSFSSWTPTNCTLANSTSASTTCTVTGAGSASVTANFTATNNNNLPNLTPFQPNGWSAPVVASTSPAGTTDTPLFTTADSVYVAWALINNGTASAGPGMSIYVYLDGAIVRPYQTADTLDPYWYYADTGIALGTLSPGMHTVALVGDSTNAIAESDESDNRYTKSIRVGTAPVTCALGDFNGDHKADILWRIDWTGSDAMWLMNGATKSLGQYIETSPSRWIVAGIGDFDGDTHADILWRDPVTGENAIWLMNGTTKTLGAYIESAGPEWVVAGIGDFNGDHKADILWRNLATGADAMWLMNGTTKTLGTYIESAAPNWIVAGIGDFNNDGMADILWRDDVTGADAIWLMSGTTKSVGAVIESAPQRWRVVGVGDFNLDGRADILWRDFVTGENAIWLMNGTTKSVGALIESAPPQWRAVGVGDLDGDGRADILWRDTSGNDAVWLMNGTTKSVGAYAESASMPWRVP